MASEKENTNMGPTQGKAASGFLGVVNAMQSKEQLKNEYVRDASTVSGQAVFNAFKRKKNRTFEDLTLAKDLAKEADAEERSIKADQAAQNNMSANAMSQTMRELYDLSKKYQSFVSTAKKKDVEDEVVEQNKDEINRMIQSPAAGAMERLSIQDYFPTIQDDIAVGTYSGRRLGSATIFAAPGFVTPVGMLDARKRALAETVKNKQKALDDIMSIADAPEQFNKEYKLRANEAIQRIAANHGYDVNAIMRDKDAMAEIYRWQTTAEAFVNVDEQIDALIANRIDKDGNISYYIEKDVLDFMYGFKSGKLEDMDDYLSGKKNISEKLLKVKTYADGTRMVDRNMPSILANPRELPLNLKKGTEINQAALNEIEDARKRIGDGSGYDAYLTVVKKYYDIDVKGMVNTWMTDVGYEPDSEARDWTEKYAWSRIPDETLQQAIHYQANDDYKYYELRKKREWEEKDKMAFWEMTLKKFEDGAVDKAITEANAAILAETDVNKKAALLANAYSYLEEQYGTAFKVQQSKDDPSDVYGVITVDRSTRDRESIMGNDRLTLYVTKRKWDKNTNNWSKEGGEWVSFDDFKKTVTLEYDADGNAIGVNYGGMIPASSGGDWSSLEKNVGANKTFQKDMATAIVNSKNGNLSVSPYEHHVQAGYKEGVDRHKVKVNNVSKYANAVDKTLLVETLANPVVIDGYDKDGNPIIKESTVRFRYLSDLEETSDRQTLEVLSTSKQQNKSGFGGNE